MTITDVLQELERNRPQVVGNISQTLSLRVADAVRDPHWLGAREVEIVVSWTAGPGVAVQGAAKMGVSIVMGVPQ